jgi:hypothetical protein
VSHTSFVIRGFLTEDNVTFVPHPPCFSLFSLLRIKLRDHHLVIIAVLEAESHAVLNTLTEHEYQDAFKNWQKHWEWCIHVEGCYFKGGG